MILDSRICSALKISFFAAVNCGNILYNEGLSYMLLFRTVSYGT